MADTTTQTEQNDRRPTIDTGAPVPVAVEYVEAQLMELWRDVAEAAQAKGGVHAVTMTQVLNLIVHAEDYAVGNAYIADIDMITGRHPCRVIMMYTDPHEAQMPVQAWVSIHCQVPPTGGRQVCCEQVSVAAGGQAIRQIPAAVIPIVMSDLPVFLWWPEGSPFDDYIFRQLSDILDRLIVDSSMFENPEGTLAKMATRMKTDWPKMACTDMNWGRLTPWREIIAQFFDAPTTRPYLDRIAQVTINYALSERGGANRAQALMLAGWLASRLKWEPTDPVHELIHNEDGLPPCTRLTLRVGKRIITINLEPVSRRSGTPGDLDSITMEVPGRDPNGPPEASFTVALSDKQDECATTTVQIEGAEPATHTIQLQTPDRAELLNGELEVFSHDRVYEEALELVGAFIKGVTHHGSIQPERKMSTGEPISAAQRPRLPQAPQTPQPPQGPPKGSHLD
jgi:glucose-6-phosphate dehydrogenase assembly protein OpcA